MTDTELHKIAKKTAIYGVSSGENIYTFYTEPLQAFARLIAKHEREACAKVCETFDQREAFNDEDMAVADDCAKAIRARG